MPESLLAKIISMGDLNDGPRDHSLKKILKVKGNIANVTDYELFNPMKDSLEKETLRVIRFKAKNLRDILHNRIMTYVFHLNFTVCWQPHHLS